MHRVEMLEKTIDIARTLGYQVRQDFLNGAGGGHCFVKGRKMVLLDLAQSHDEQLNDIADALRDEARLVDMEIAEERADFLDVRKVA